MLFKELFNNEMLLTNLFGRPNGFKYSIILNTQISTNKNLFQ